MQNGMAESLSMQNGLIKMHKFHKNEADNPIFYLWRVGRSEFATPGGEFRLATIEC